MLLELTVRGLGVFDATTLSFGPGLTALTGETGAGKTFLVDALALLMGGRPPRGIVASGTAVFVEAVFGRDDGTELIVAREFPVDGRAHAWVDGRSCTVAMLSEEMAGLCAIYGQHEHQSLLAPGTVRRSLDAFAGIDREPLLAARSALRALEAEQAQLGGDPAELERECAFLEHQLSVIEAAHIEGVDEIDRLLAEASLLGQADRIRASLALGLAQIEDSGERAPRDALARLRGEIAGHPSLAATEEAVLAAEIALAEAATQLRRAMEVIEVDPKRSEEVDERLRILHELTRMHGPTLSDVLSTQRAMDARVSQLRSAIEDQGSLVQRITAQLAQVTIEEVALEERRRSAAPGLLESLRSNLADLALDRAEVDLVIDGPGGESVDLRFSANRGHALQSVSAVASGGELARLMLGLRLTLPGGPSCMIFDEVDAGIGGSTALALADALAEVAVDRQVLVVTHLAQVAARASRQVVVVKEPGDRDLAMATELDDHGRVGEIARMLSGQPDSDAARRHARELLGLEGVDAGQLPFV